MALRALAGGAEPAEGLRRHGARLLGEAAWTRANRPMDEWTAFEAVGPTLDALWLVAGPRGYLGSVRPEEAARQLARAALLGTLTTR